MDKVEYNYDINYFSMYVNLIKPYILACTDGDMKQYMLYFIYVRAKMMKIKETSVNELLIEMLEDDIENNVCSLSINQYDNAKKGYTDNRKISNKIFTKKTGIIFYSEESNTEREFVREIIRKDKFSYHSKRVDLLKRLVKRKKDVTVDEILDHFDKHNVKIGRTKFYNTQVYMVIMSDLYKNGDVKVIKKNGDYIYK